MLKKLITFLLLIGLAIIFWFADLRYPSITLRKLSYTFVTLALCYFLFKLILEEPILKSIKESKTRYSFRKTTSLLYLIVSFVIILRIWIVNPQVLIVSFGLIAAGVAISLQDFFKNVAGGIIIFLNRIYRVGDRIEINGRFGDVIDIGVLYTSLLEIREWVQGDQATGRITIVPNGYVLSHSINNYTKDHNFIWDEINIPITYGSDWKEATIKILDIVQRETGNLTEQAEREISQLTEKYYLDKRQIEPAIFLELTDNWISFNIRYITKARERRLLHNKLSQMILNEIQKSKNIKIASETLDIVGFPRTKQNRF